MESPSQSHECEYLDEERVLRIQKFAEKCAKEGLNLSEGSVLENVFGASGILTPEEMEGYKYFKAYEHVDRERDKVRKQIHERMPKRRFGGIWGDGVLVSSVNEYDVKTGLDGCVNTCYNTRFQLGVHSEPLVCEASKVFLEMYMKALMEQESFDEELVDEIVFSEQGLFDSMYGKERLWFANECGRFLCMKGLYEKCYEVFGQMLLREKGEESHYGGASGKTELEHAFSLGYDNSLSEMSAALSFLWEVAEYWSKKEYVPCTKDRRGQMNDVQFNLKYLLEDLRFFDRGNAFLEYADWGVGNMGMDSVRIDWGSGKQTVRSGHLEYWKEDCMQEEGFCHQKVSADTLFIANEYGHAFDLVQEAGGSVSYEKVLSDKKLNPLGKDPKSLAHMLRSFHHPVFRGQVERDLGISYESMTLKQQLWLLHFLETRPKEDVQVLGAFLRSSKTNERLTALSSFVACALDVDAGNVLLQLMKVKLAFGMNEIGSIDDLYSHRDRGASLVSVSGYRDLGRERQKENELHSIICHPSKHIESRGISVDWHPISELTSDARNFLNEQIQLSHPGLDGYHAFLQKEIGDMRKSGNSFFMVLRDKEDGVVGINSGSGAIDGRVKVGKLYVSEEYRKDFNIGTLLYFARDQFLDQTAQKYSTVAFENPVWFLHLMHGWVLDGIIEDEILGDDVVFDITQIIPKQVVEKKYEVVCGDKDRLFQVIRTSFSEGYQIIGASTEDGEIGKKLEDCFPCTVSVGSVNPKFEDLDTESSPGESLRNSMTA